jgi:hypothetical protein
MSAAVVKFSSILGIVGWTLLASLAVATDGIGDGSGVGRKMPTSFYLPFIYFTICIVSCFLSRRLLLLAGIMGNICLGSIVYLLIIYGWLPMISVCLTAILLGHGVLWWMMLKERIKKNE